MPNLRDSGKLRLYSKILLGLSPVPIIALAFVAIYGHINKEKALEIALTKIHFYSDRKDPGIPKATWENGQWIITFSEISQPLYLTRNGRVAGFGG